MLYHVGVPGITGGFVGVDVFFVISGYLITSLLVLETETRGRISLSSFYARRIRRLFPALMVVVLATLVLGAIWLLPVFSEQTDLAKSAIATAFYVSNVYFWLFTGDYFGAPAALEPLLHTWTLAVEEQFYLFWPLLIIGALRLGRIRQTDLKRDLFKAVAVLFVISFVIGVWQTAASPRAAFYLMPARAWEFAVGGIVALILPREKRSAPTGAGWLSAVGLLVIIGSAVVSRRQGALSGLQRPHADARRMRGDCRRRAESEIACGAISYHPADGADWSVVVLLVPVALATPCHQPSERVAEIRICQRDLIIGGVSLIAAAVTYYFVENPIRYKRPGPFSAPASTLWTGAVISDPDGGYQLRCLSLSARYVGA